MARATLATTAQGSGPPVVLVHGFTQSAASFAPLAAALATDHRVMLVDLPGHGASGPVVTADLEAAAELLGAAGGRAAYLGYSLGGRCCLTLALNRPDLVERLVLVGATAGIEDPAERAARASADDALAERLDPEGTERLDLESFLEEWLAGPLFAELAPQARDLPARRVNTPGGLASSLRTLSTGRQAPRWGELGRLAMPTLCVAGERDAKFAALAERLATAIGPNARSARIAGAGHAAPFEAPEAFRELVAPFLAGA